MSELLYKIGITKIPKVGPVLARNLISYCGGVKAVFEASKKELLKIPNIGPQIAERVVRQDVLKIAEKELLFNEKHGIQALFYLDKNYPSRLKHLHDSPVMLYYKGTANLNHRRIVGVVGTRKPTVRGVAYCEEIMEGLKAYDVITVSGLAYGIDATSHKKCLDLGIETVGVVGHGLKMIYPPQHRSLAEKMVHQGGLLTEYTSDTKVEREHFPMRNRIIAGVCDALIVVETAKRGGSMISAHIGNNYNKDVFAVPGRLNDKYSQGCNHLIKTHKAALLESADDIAYVMQWEKNKQDRGIQRQLFVELNEKERFIVDMLKETEHVSIDSITYKAQLSSSEAAGLMLELEFKGVVKTLPGKRYVLI